MSVTHIVYTYIFLQFNTIAPIWYYLSFDNVLWLIICFKCIYMFQFLWIKPTNFWKLKAFKEMLNWPNLICSFSIVLQVVSRMHINCGFTFVTLVALVSLVTLVALIAVVSLVALVTLIILVT